VETEEERHRLPLDVGLVGASDLHEPRRPVELNMRIEEQGKKHDPLYRRYFMCMCYSKTPRPTWGSLPCRPWMHVAPRIRLL